MEIVERDGFCICGYVVETSIATASEDVAQLYADFSVNGREYVARDLTVEPERFDSTVAGI